MTNKKELSIVIAYYNNQTILECLMWILNALKKRKRESYEILIVDDSSKYPLSIPVQAFLKRNKIKHFKKKKNAGISEVRNTALDLTTGEIIVFLDADSYVKEDYFKRVEESFREFKNSGMVFGKREPWKDKPFKRFRELKYRYKSGKYQEKQKKEFTLKNSDFYLVSGQNMAIKREVIRKIGYFIPNSGCEDIEMQYLIMHAGFSTLYDPELIIFHEHDHEYWHYLKKAYRYGKGFQRFKERQGIRLLRNKYYRIYMGAGRIFEKFENLKGKKFRYKLEVWMMEIGDYLANKLARYAERRFGNHIPPMLGAYGVIYRIKNKRLEFLVAKYGKEYGLIGGRVDKGENLRKAFLRELDEEVGITKDKIKEIILTKEINSFASNRSKGMEQHHFFLVKADNQVTAKSKDVNFEWLSDKKISKFTKWERTQKIVNKIVDQIKENENL